MIKEFCDKMKGKSFCDDCDNCPIGEVIKSHNVKVKADTIDMCIAKLYEVTPHTVDQKLDMVFVRALRELKEQE